MKNLSTCHPLLYMEINICAWHEIKLYTVTLIRKQLMQLYSLLLCVHVCESMIYNSTCTCNYVGMHMYNVNIHVDIFYLTRGWSQIFPESL